MNSSRSLAAVVWESPNLSEKSSMIFYADAKAILESWRLRRIWPEQRLVSCRWRQTGPFTWKRTRLWTNFDRFGRPHWEQDVTTYLTIGGQRRLITSSPVFATWQKHLTAGTSYWTTCPSSSVLRSQGTNGRPLTKS